MSFLLSSLFFLLLNAAILNICNISMFIPTTNSIHREKNLVSLQYVEDHVTSYLTEYSQHVLSQRDEFFTCDNFDLNVLNTPLLDCISKIGYILARHYKFKEVFSTIKLENMGAILFTTNKNIVDKVVLFGGDPDAPVMLYVNQSWVYKDYTGMNAYDSKLILSFFNKQTRSLNFAWYSPLPVPYGKTQYLDNEDYYVGLDKWDVNVARFHEAISKYNVGSAYDLNVVANILSPTDGSYIGATSISVNMDLIRDFLNDIKIENAEITLVNSDNHNIISSTTDVEIVEQVDGVKYHIMAHRSKHKPLSTAYLQIKESEDVNAEYEKGRSIAGRVVQARKFSVSGYNVIAIVSIKESVMFESVIVSTLVYFFVSVLLLVFASIISCCCACCITTPLSSVISKMEKIKEMKLDKIKIRRKSALWEVRRIESSLLFTVDKLKEYRAFLPTYMYGDEGPGDFQSDTGDMTSSSISVYSEKTNDNSTSASATDGSRTSKRDSRTGSSSNLTNTSGSSHASILSSESHTGMRTKFDLGYRKRTMTIVAIEFTPVSMEFCYTSVLSLHKPGLIYQFYFDRIIVIIMRESLIRRYVLQLCDFREKNYSSKMRNMDGGGFKITIVQGLGVYGNLGNHSIKKFSVGGEVMKKLEFYRYALNTELTHRQDNQSDINLVETSQQPKAEQVLFPGVSFIICSEIFRLMKHELTCRLLREDIYEVGRKRGVKDSEWMYELKERNEVAKWRKYNEGIGEFELGHYNEAMMSLLEFKKENNHDLVVDYWIQKIQNLMELEEISKVEIENVTKVGIAYETDDGTCDTSTSIISGDEQTEEDE